ncbi:histone PARylation factor 1 isoform X2 [Euwallacea similis]|uniref:histone PARylation factor 1 isoform X2 n=1 Tax=Euwallacea similis TaxID=1736056 RepID=UPI00344BD7E9
MAETGATTVSDQNVNDPRMACKYGVRCYQKNPVHLQKYKHPPPKRTQKDETPVQQPTKKFKFDDARQNNVPDKAQKDISRKSPESEDCKPPKTKDDIVMDPNNEAANANCEVPEKIISDITGKNSPVKCDLSLESATINSPGNCDPKIFMKQKFLVDMPTDFYEFWDFCKSLNEKCPEEAFKSVHLILVGPYDVLAGKFYNTPYQSEENYLIHWRYYYDPPECQTVLKGADSTGYHLGYYRDSPKEDPAFLVNNSANVDGLFRVVGDNIFAAVNIYLEDWKKSCNPFEKITVKNLHRKLKKRAEQLQLNLLEKSEKIKIRDKKIVFRSFSKLGIVIPYNRRAQVGYRSLSVTNKQLQKMLTDIAEASPEQKRKFLSQLQDIITNVTIATDECDFGAGIELGLDILAHGVDSLNRTIASCLSTNYRLIDREEFAKIIEAHMKNRKKGVDLSIV